MYEEMLDFILAAVRALNTLDEKNSSMMLESGIKVLYDNEVIGELVDEIGGVWSFREIRNGE